MRIRVFYPTRNKEINYDRDWSIKVSYKEEFPTKADVLKDYKELPISDFWNTIDLDVKTFKPWLLDKIFQLMNDYKTNPLSSEEMQKWIRENKVRHTSMSVGDVIAIDDTFYVCANEGWKEA